MKHSPNCPEDLLVLARRGGLSSYQLERLQQDLQVSSILRVADEVGRAFDQIAEVYEGDEQRIAASVDRVIGRTSPGAARAPRAWRLGLVAAIVLGSASAMGYWGVHSLTGGSESGGAEVRTVDVRRPRSSASAAELRARPRVGSDSATPAVSGGNELRAKHALPPGSDSDHASSASRIRGDSLRGSGASLPMAAFPAEAAGPAAVFSAANAARRAGRQDRAVALYLDLQQNYPSSAEASLSHVSLGRLLVARHELQAALVQFSTYLRGGGPLEEEALLGKAQALAALGRQADARTAWQTLLGRYPHSVYAAEAREHLDREPR